MCRLLFANGKQAQLTSDKYVMPLIIQTYDCQNGDMCTMAIKLLKSLWQQKNKNKHDLHDIYC